MGEVGKTAATGVGRVGSAEMVGSAEVVVAGGGATGGEWADSASAVVIAAFAAAVSGTGPVVGSTVPVSCADRHMPSMPDAVGRGGTRGRGVEHGCSAMELATTGSGTDAAGEMAQGVTASVVVVGGAVPSEGSGAFSSPDWTDAGSSWAGGADTFSSTRGGGGSVACVASPWASTACSVEVLVSGGGLMLAVCCGNTSAGSTEMLESGTRPVLAICCGGSSTGSTMASARATCCGSACTGFALVLAAGGGSTEAMLGGGAVSWTKAANREAAPGVELSWPAMRARMDGGRPGGENRPINLSFSLV